MDPEPWLRGPVAGVDARLAPLLYTFQHAREDLAKHTEDLTASQIWSRPHGWGPLGYHLRHIAGSTERLMTYVQGQQLTPEQLEAIHTQMDPGATRDELLAEIDAAFSAAEKVVRAFDPARLSEPREVGRQKLPSTVIGLLTHIAEHIMRHVGESIVYSRLARMEPPDR